MTLEEIAQKAGVGRSTVSRVMNNDPRVRESTRQRVLEIVRRENYTPNFAARSLASGRTDVIGAVVPMDISSVFADPFFPLLLKGVGAGCEAADALLMLWIAEPEYEQRMVDKVLQAGAVDGLVIAAHSVHDPLVDALIQARKRFILTGPYQGRDDVSYVGVDDRASAQAVVSHLLRLARRRIATIRGPQTMIAGGARFVGYKNALRQFEVSTEISLVAQGDWSEASGYAAMQRLIPEKPDAVFAANDLMALGALRALADAGVSVPDDVAVVGFDDLPAASEAAIPLTTVRQPIRRLGEVAAHTLLEIIHDRAQAPQQVILPTELVVRASCGSSSSNGHQSDTR
jgi:LacI family transcriptional regulator